MVDLFQADDLRLRARGPGQPLKTRRPVPVVLDSRSKWHCAFRPRPQRQVGARTFFRIFSAVYLPLALWRAIRTRLKVPVPAQREGAGGGSIASVRTVAWPERHTAPRRNGYTSTTETPSPLPRSLVPSLRDAAGSSVPKCAVGAPQRAPLRKPPYVGTPPRPTASHIRPPRSSAAPPTPQHPGALHLPSVSPTTMSESVIFIPLYSAPPSRLDVFGILHRQPQQRRTEEPPNDFYTLESHSIFPASIPISPIARSVIISVLI